MLYHKHACEAVDEDSLLELADWCVRKLAYLNSGAHKAAAAKGKGPTPCGRQHGLNSSRQSSVHYARLACDCSTAAAAT